MKPFTISSIISFCKNGEILCYVKLYNKKISIFVFFLPLMLLCMHDLVVLPLVCLSMLDQFKFKDTYYMFSPLSWQWTNSFHLKTSISYFYFLFLTSRTLFSSSTINSFVLWFPFKCYLFQLYPHPPHASHHICNP
jgi:hypothetical protein